MFSGGERRLLAGYLISGYETSGDSRFHLQEDRNQSWRGQDKQDPSLRSVGGTVNKGSNLVKGGAQGKGASINGPTVVGN